MAGAAGVVVSGWGASVETGDEPVVDMESVAGANMLPVDDTGVARCRAAIGESMGKPEQAESGVTGSINASILDRWCNRPWGKLWMLQTNRVYWRWKG